MSTDSTPTIPPIKITTSTFKSSAPSRDLLKNWPDNHDENSSDTSNDFGKKIEILPENMLPNQELNIKGIKKSPSILADQVPGRKFTFANETPYNRILSEDAKTIFGDEKSKFIGTFSTENFRLMKGYLNGSTPLLRLYYTKLEPYGGKLASLCIVHGFGEHSGRFMDVAEFFVNKGFVVHLIDLRGFGFSGGPRANASAEEMHRDIEVLLRQASPNLPLFLYGHSMGAALVTSLLIKNPYIHISGVILTSGLFGFPKERNMPWAKRSFIKLAGELLEDFTVSSGINTTALSYSNHNVQRILEDNLTTSVMGFRQVKALIELLEFNIPNAYRFHYPCLIIHGNNDLITDYRASIKLYKNMGSEHKELKIVEDGLHELHHDLEKEELKAYISQWMYHRLDKSSRNIGDFHTLCVGLKHSNKYMKTILGMIVIGVYSYLLRYFRGHQLYDTKFKKFWYPLFYLYNVLLKKHSLSLKIKQT